MKNTGFVIKHLTHLQGMVQAANDMPWWIIVGAAGSGMAIIISLSLILYKGLIINEIH